MTTARTVLVLGLKLVGLSTLLFACFAVAAAIVALPDGRAEAAPESAGAAAVALVAVCVLNTAVMAYVILRSRWSGWRLAATVFVVYYGVTTVMPQVESAVFLTRLPAGFLPRLFLMGAVVAAIYSPLAVAMLGRWSDGTAEEPRGAMPTTSRLEWAWRLAAVAAVYVALYFTFGYYVAWRDPAVAEYYGGVDPGGLFAQLGNVMRDTPWLPAFQVLRALMWALLAAPVIRMTKGRWWEAGLATSLLFAVVMNAQLLLPNPYMPEAVRVAHLVETATSNFIFGWVVVWLLRPLLVRDVVETA